MTPAAAATRRAAPPVPPETCPVCDSLSVLLDAISADLQTYHEGLAYSRRKTVDIGDVTETLLDAMANLASARLQVEELRTANKQLRESGRYWREAHRALAGA